MTDTRVSVVSHPFTPKGEATATLGGMRRTSASDSAVCSARPVTSEAPNRCPTAKAVELHEVEAISSQDGSRHTYTRPRRFLACSCCGELVEQSWAEEHDPQFFGPEGDGPLLCERCRADEPPEMTEDDYRAAQADMAYANRGFL